MTINRLDDKYLVLKWDDINKLDEENFTGIQRTITKINQNRLKNNKKDNHYVVLNLDDEIDLEHFGICASAFYDEEKVTVRDISIHLVNAILKAKESRQ